ncbi:hypothetical protein VNO78_13225 [Psophocarpus tetragonolobus]|uniref:TF-B3 domain-containing protein n=1 Tax=Psophocarpus tetragonolobus TaxID=3891 RepID=A0AAN9SPW8_PSOTE
MDEIVISKSFYEFWGDKLLPGLANAMDPNGNVVELMVSTSLDCPDIIKLSRSFLFWHKFDVTLGNVLLVDPMGNLLRINLEVDFDSLLCFTLGVEELRDFYNLKNVHEAWLHYDGNNHFEIRIFGLDKNEIFYPNMDDNSDDEENDESTMVLLDVDDGWSWTMSVSKALAEGRTTLLIPESFVDSIIPHTQGRIDLISEDDRIYKCQILCDNNRPNTKRYLGGLGWYNFVKNNNLHYGDALKFWWIGDLYDLHVEIIKALRDRKIDRKYC